MSVTREWASWIAAVRSSPANIPDDVRRGSVVRTADVIGCAVRGLASPHIQAIAEEWSTSGSGGDAIELYLPEGHARRFDSTDLAFLLAAAAHCSDFDDTHFGSLTHPSSAPIGAALAAGARYGANASEVANAITIGRETTIRIGLAFGNSLGGRGLNTSTIASTVGAAAAAAVLRPGADAASIAAAVQIAAGMGAGTQAWAADGADNKWLQFGFAAATGFRAARSAVPGIRTAQGALDGTAGLLNAMSPDAHSLDPLTDRLGDLWHTNDVQLKPFPTPNGTHAIFDALNETTELDDLALEDIEAVEMEVSRYTESLTCIPWKQKLAPDSEYALRFSLPALVLLAIRHRVRTSTPFVASRIALEDLDDTGDLISRFSYELYVDRDGRTPLIGVPGVLRIRTRERVIALTAERYRGARYLGTNLSKEEISVKFVDNLRSASPVADSTRVPTMDAAAANRVISAVLARGENALDLSASLLMRAAAEEH